MNTPILPPATLLKSIGKNCEISDARDHGIYSMCTMILRLRNLFKWENGLEPWEEPDPPVLLDWIDEKETYWEKLAQEEYRSLTVNGKAHDPFKTRTVNNYLSGSGLFYGAGYGRAMKSVFFLGRIYDAYEVKGCPLIIVGKEHVRDMAEALAFVQDGSIIVRRELIRYFFWDQIQEMRASCRSSVHYALDWHNLRTDKKLDHERLKDRLEDVVETELDIFIHHEVGELLEKSLDSAGMRSLTGRFPGSIIEFVVRTVKDLLADTGPDGLLTYLIAANRHSGIGFYLGFLDGLRQKLFPEIISAWSDFMVDGDWDHIEKARISNREKCLVYAEKIMKLAKESPELSDDIIQQRFRLDVLTPLGLDLPAES